MRYVYNGDDPQYPSLTVYQPAEPKKKVLTAWLFICGYGSYKTSNIRLSIMMAYQKQQFIYDDCRYSVSENKSALDKLVKVCPFAKEHPILSWFFLLNQKIAPFLESIKNGFKNEKDAYEFLSRTSDDFALPEIWLHLLNYSHTVSGDRDCMLFLSNHLNFFLERYGVKFTRRLVQPLVNYEYVDYYSGTKYKIFHQQFKILSLPGLSVKWSNTTGH